MRFPRAALTLSLVSVLTIAACSKPTEEAAPEGHADETAAGDHAEAAKEDVVTMEQAVEDARAAAEAPAAATPAPAAAAPAAEGQPAQSGTQPESAGAALVEAAPAATAEHASGH